VAAAATVEVHPRAKTFVDFFRGREIGRARVEECALVRGQVGERPAGTWSSAAHAGIAGVETELGRRDLDFDKNKVAIEPANNEDVTSLLFMLVSS
jgi:hypothetical protein